MFREPSVVGGETDLLEFLETGKTGRQLLSGLGLETVMFALRGH